jgi:hypothetical protein
VILPPEAELALRPLRPRALQPRDPQHRELLAALVDLEPHEMPGGARSAARRFAPGPRPRRRRGRTRRLRRDEPPGARFAAARDVEDETPTSSRRRSRCGAARSASSISCCAGPYGDGFGGSRRALARSSRVAAARHRSRTPAAAGARDAAHADGDDRARAGTVRRRRGRGCEPRSIATGTPTAETSAVSAPTTPGCTISTCS